MAIVLPLRAGSVHDIIAMSRKTGEPAFDWSGLQQFTRQMLEALMALGENDIVHHDVKPANILYYTLDGNPVTALSFNVLTELAISVLQKSTRVLRVQTCLVWG